MLLTLTDGHGVGIFKKLTRALIAGTHTACHFSCTTGWLLLSGLSACGLLHILGVFCYLLCEAHFQFCCLLQLTNFCMYGGQLRMAS